ncbi:MAG: efflux RND transporter periplasmic adaptor subunit [Bacteroidales bacterium]|nr:efflux RND transporter periplasmic adaptor subunit [Bacteroidales bacterium]
MKTKQFIDKKLVMPYRPIMIIAILAIILYSCGGQVDQSARLQELKKQRDDLNKEIKALEKEIVNKGGTIDAGIKIPTVVAQKIQPEVFSHFIDVRGNVESDNNIFVPAMRPYVVTKILVREGDHVSKGQLMAELDNESISQTIREIKNGLELATTLFERQKNLWEKKIGTEVQYLQAKTSKEDLEIKLKTAQNELDKTRLYSPIDGIVDLVVIKEGEAAVLNLGAIRVSNPSSQKVVAKVSENYITNVMRGDKVSVYLPTIDLTLTSVISAVSQVIDRDNRTIDIEIKLPDDRRISPNMLAVVTLNDYSNPSAVLLPINAIQRSESRDYVFIAKKINDNWIAELRDVEIGKFGQEKVEIKGGLMKDDIVITFGFNNISVGDPVNLTFAQY